MELYPILRLKSTIILNEEDYQSIGTVYKLDMKSKDVFEIFRFPLNAMSVKGVYDEQTNSVYIILMNGIAIRLI